MSNFNKLFVSLALLISCIVTASAQVSVPATPSQPDASSYSVFELHLVKSYTRESYRAAFGLPAKPYDPSRRIKTWFDSTKNCDDPDEITAYRSLGSDKSGSPIIRQFVITSCEAATVNLPGLEPFSRYEIAPTGAIVKGFSLGEETVVDVPVDPVTLSTRWEAEQIAAEIGLSMKVTEFVLPPPYSYFWPLSELRRQWKIGPYFAGQLIAAKNAHGVGRPGKWSITRDLIEWTPTLSPPTGLNDSRPNAPIPVRDLLPNERLVGSPFGVRVERTDRQTSTGTGSSFSDEDRKTLRLILEILQKR